MNDYEYSEQILEHFGVKGMKWGVRKDGPAGVSSKVNRMASKDAKEHALAKQYYGKGAGTRRKLINETVAQRSRSIGGYKKAFDYHLDRQDMAKASAKAVSKRKRTDRSERFKQRTGAVARRLTGEFGTQAALVAAAFAGYQYVQSPQGRAMMGRAANTVNPYIKKIF